MTAIEAAIRFKEASLRTGVKLRYAEAGPRDGKPVLLLHGYSDSWFSFSRIPNVLPSDLRLIMPDQRGHGDSERPENGYSMRGFAEDAVALLDTLHIDAAAVVGHSMGSFIAQQMLGIAPKRVSTMVLVSSAATADNEVVRSLLPEVQNLTDPVNVEFVREFQMSTMYRPVPPAFVDRAIAESLKLPAFVWKAVLAGMLDLPVTTDSATARCRTELIWGDQDAIFGRRDQEALLQRYPHAELRVLSEVGHAPHWEAPEDFAQLLEEAVR